MEALTTTRVAARAGVSVGSLYQYFPNKHSLLASVLEQHLLHVVEAVEQACRSAKGANTRAMAKAVVDAFFEAKFAEANVSRALYAVAAEVSGDAVITRMTLRSQLALCEMLATASNRTFTELASIGFVLSTAIIGPVQALLAVGAPAGDVARVRDQLVAMLSAYLERSGVPPGTRRRRE